MIALTNVNNFNMYHFCSLLTSLKALIKGGWLCSLAFINGRYFNISFKIHSLILGWHFYDFTNLSRKLSKESPKCAKTCFDFIYCLNRTLK